MDDYTRANVFDRGSLQNLQAYESIKAMRDAAANPGGVAAVGAGLGAGMAAASTMQAGLAARRGREEVWQLRPRGPSPREVLPRVREPRRLPAVLHRLWGGHPGRGQVLRRLRRQGPHLSPGCTRA